MSEELRDKMRAEYPNGFTGETAPTLPDLPEDAAEAGMSALLLAIGQGPRLDRDPYAVAKAANFDRLIFGKMPVLCAGPTGVLHIGQVTL